MKYLLDTHVLLWTAFSPGRISTQARAEIANPKNDVYLSPVSYWEISLKYALGKLSLAGMAPEELPAVFFRSGFQELPLGTEDLVTFHKLPRLKHQDPFDRMLVWIAIKASITLLSRDPEMKEYEKNGLQCMIV